VRVACHVQPLHPDDPTAAARAAGAAALDGFARRRGLVLAGVVHGAAPGLTAARWTLEGLREVVVAAGHVVRATIPLGADALDGPFAEHGWGVTASRDDGFGLDLGAGARLRPRRAWIGRALCLVAPLAHVRDRGRGGWAGPVRGALAELARAAGASARASPDELARIGGRLAAATFAGTGVLVDASWWTAIVRDRAADRIVGAAPLVSPEHLLAAAVGPGVDPYGVAVALDRWITEQLGLRVVVAEPESAGAREVQLRLHGKRLPWPWARGLPADPRPGWPDRNVESLWRTPASTRGAIGAPVPGRLAGAWSGRPS
jgi:hypothetical protein